MTLAETKKEMLEWRDFYGGDIMYTNEIKKAKTKKQLSDIIEKYRQHLEMMAVDADSHLDKLKVRLKLTMLDLG